MNGPFLPALVALTTLVVASPHAQTDRPADRLGRYLSLEQITLAEGRKASYPSFVSLVREAADRTKADTTWWIAVANLTGDSRRVTNMTFHETFAAFEAAIVANRGITVAAADGDPGFAARRGEHVLASSSSLAVLRDDLSFQPAKVPPSAARYWSITTMFLKAGHMSDFAERTKLEIDLLKRGGLDHHFLVYQVLLGVPSSGAVFYVITPMRTLAEMDADDSAKAARLFTPDVRRRFEAMNREMVSGIESDLLVVRPELSRPPASFVSANPGFWPVTSPR